MALKAGGSSPSVEHLADMDDKKYTSLPKRIRGLFGMDLSFYYGFSFFFFLLHFLITNMEIPQNFLSLSSFWSFLSSFFSLELGFSLSW